MSRKTFFLVIINLIVFYLATSAQTALRYNMQYKYGHEVIAESKDSADFFRLIFPRDSTDKLFLVNDFYKTGKPQMAGKSITPGPYVVLQGVSVQFFPNGQKKSEINFKNGKRVDDFEFYYPNGKTYLNGKYDADGKLIINECLDSIGKTLAASGNGHIMKYSDDFKKIIAEGDIVNGRENGEWRGTDGDTVNYICWYDNGILKKGVSHLNGKEYTFKEVKIGPSFNGGDTQALYRFIASHLNYPAEARQQNIQGKVILTFNIEKDGSLSNIKVARGLGGGCNEEVLRVLKLSPKWIPGQAYGIPIRIGYTMPISFTLENDN